MQFFRTPFSRAYWKAACSELRDVRMLTLAALLIAVRIGLNSLRIPIIENLYISAAFMPTALGGLVYGPVVALLAGLVCDTLGALLFPIGPYFPPFALVEMLGGLLFALFLYKAPLRVWRIAGAKFSVNLLCNVLLTPLFLAWMNGKAAVLTSMPRIAKNVLLFPLEAFLLAVLLSALLPVLKRMRLICEGQAAPELSARQIIVIVGFFVLSAVAVTLYYFWFMS